MPRITVRIDPLVLEKLKRRAKREGKSLGDVMTELVRPALSGESSGTAKRGLRWNTARMGPASIELEDAEAVRRAQATGYRLAEPAGEPAHRTPAELVAEVEARIGAEGTRGMTTVSSAKAIRADRDTR